MFGKPFFCRQHFFVFRNGLKLNLLRAAQPAPFIQQEAALTKRGQNRRRAFSGNMFGKHFFVGSTFFFVFRGGLKLNLLRATQYAV